MARIRTIKPEFPQSESIGKLSRDARLLYIQLWTIVDDAGRTRAASRMLASLLYPYDDDARELIDGWLLELERGEHIRRYEVDGSQYLEIAKWLEHQKIDRPSPSRLPEYREPDTSPREPSRALDADLVPSTVDLVPEPISPVAKATRPANSRFEEFWKEYPKRDGDNPRKPAEKKFNALVKTGVDPEVMIAGARQASTDARARGIYATKFVPQAIKWLNDQRFLDCAAASFSSDPSDDLIEVLEQHALEAWDAYRMKTEGKVYPRNKKGGWRFPSKFPPGYEEQQVRDVQNLVAMMSMQ